MSYYPLFHLSEQKTFSRKIRTLQHADLTLVFGSTILGRGQSYCHNGQIEDIRFHPGKVTAEALGQEVYQLEIAQEGRQMAGYCSCPYEGPCKHLAGLLLCLINDGDPEEMQILDTSAPGGSENTVFEDYVHTLTIEELQQLVIQLAPESFRQTIQLKFADAGTRLREFQQVKKRVKSLFGRDLYDIESFTTKLSQLMEQLRGVWLDMPDETGALCLYVIAQVGESFEEGYLYDDYSDHAYEGLDFGIYLAEFVAILPRQKRSVWLPKLWEAVNGMAYTTFDNFAKEMAGRITPEELVHFKELLVENDILWDLAENDRIYIYQRIEPVLKDREKQSLLEELSSSSNFFTAQLAAAYEGTGEIARAVELLDTKLNESAKPHYFSLSSKDDLFEYRIRLEEKYRDGASTLKLTKQYLKNIPTVKSIRFAKGLLPTQLPRFERILEKQNPHQFVAYLEEEERLSEIPPLFEK